jgi:hypothetical protein
LVCYLWLRLIFRCFVFLGFPSPLSFFLGAFEFIEKSHRCSQMSHIRLNFVSIAHIGFCESLQWYYLSNDY